MKHTLFLIFIIFPFLLNSQTIIKGLVAEQNSGNKPIGGVQIIVLGSTPEQTDNAGLFQLVFTSKKPGDRIIVSEIFKKGYEIVNKDIVNNWLIPSNQGDKTKIVMCPEGLIAQNTLKYYDISLAGLTNGYESRIKSLQAKMTKAEIDAKTYGELAKAVSEQFENQQKQLEELAGKFARENFDDCSSVHKQAFEAFKVGDISEAIRILESVNSEVEIEKAKQQQQNANNLINRGKEILKKTDSIIRQNISKLIFQADLYKTDLRYKDAEKAYRTAIDADSSNFENLYEYVIFLNNINDFDRSIEWNLKAVSTAKNENEKIKSLRILAFLYKTIFQYEKSEKFYSECLNLSRNLIETDSQLNKSNMVTLLLEFADFQTKIKKYTLSENLCKEALNISTELCAIDSNKYNKLLAFSLRSIAGNQCLMRYYAKSEENYKKAIAIYKIITKTKSAYDLKMFAGCYNGLANMYKYNFDFLNAEINYNESLKILRELVKENPVALKPDICTLLNNLSDTQIEIDKYDLAASNLSEAILLSKELSSSNPVYYKNLHCNLLNSIAEVYIKKELYEKADSNLTENIQILKELAKENPAVFKIKLINNIKGLGSLYIQMNLFEKGEAYLSESLKLLRELAVSDPDSYRPILAFELNDIGWIIYSYNLPQALLYTNESVAINQELAKKDSTLLKSLAFAYARNSKLYIFAKAFREAEECARMALKYNQRLNGARKNLAHSLLFQGKYKKAKEIYIEIKDLFPPNQKTLKYKDFFLMEFDEFEKAGITHTDVVKIKDILNQK
ncbi:MAG: tetratricopeptide repeat protein [Bacteroidales bacterium]